MNNTIATGTYRSQQTPQRTGKELVLSSAYAEILHIHLLRIRRIKYTLAFLFGFWACNLFVELNSWLGAP